MTIFMCPICGQRLTKEKTRWLCPGGHSYDRAAEGYVHLLPPNKKHSKDPGDDRQMVAARRRFLGGGHYAAFSAKLNQLVLEALGQTAAPVVLDAGCGEGWYDGRLRDEFIHKKINPYLCGFDISKNAVRVASKACKDMDFAVASMFAIPVVGGSVDCLINVFAPIVAEEFFRVLKPGGTLILAVPSPRHLMGLKEILYDEPYENEQKDTDYPGFAFLGRHSVRGQITLTDAQTVHDLFSMTPYFWKTPQSGSQRLDGLEQLETEIGFDFLCYIKQKE